MRRWGWVGLVGLAIACGSADKDLGGASGGAAGAAGAGASGGSGAGGSGATGAGGSGGSAVTPCVSDRECTPAGLLCDKVRGHCVACISADDCEEGDECLAGTCREVVECRNSLDCPSGEVCSPALRRCYPCITTDDCGAGRVCIENTCHDLGTGGAGGSGGSGGSGAGGSGGSGAGGSGGFGAGGSGGSGAGGSGGSGGGGSCGDLYLLLDRSASMTSNDAWAHLHAAIVSFVDAPGASSSGVGLGWFPVDYSVTPSLPSSCTDDAQCGEYGPCYAIFGCTGSAGSDSCDVHDYAAPSVPVGPLATTRTSILTEFTTTSPDGASTPLTPALRGALDYARGSASARGRRTSVVVVTDGEPTSCTVNDVASVKAAAQLGMQGSPQVKTYVVALGPLALDEIAQAGGTGAARVATSRPELEAALSQIRAAEGCP